MFFKPRIVLAPAEEVSGGNAPESKADNADIYENGDPNETFDNLDYESENSKKAGESLKDRAKKIKESKKSKEDEDSEEDEEEEKELKKPKKEDKKKSEVDTLSDKEDGVDDEDSEEEEDSDEEEETPKKKEEEEEKPLDKDKKGKIKIRMNNELYGLDSDSMVRYKVDGEWVENSLQEVLNKASGVEALDKKFTEYGQKNKELTEREAQLSRSKGILENIVKDIKGTLEDPQANPMDALLSLVEKSGGDVYTAERRLIESNLETLEKLMEMSEPERKAYWLERKDAIRTKADESRKKAYEKEQSLIQTTQKLDALRQTLGVSEEQFNLAWDELDEAGSLDKFTNEQIVEYASIKPHIESVQDVLQPYEDQIPDSQYEEIVQDFAKQIRSKKLTLEQFKTLVKKEFVDEDLKDLAAREKKTAPKKKSKEAESTKREYESFEDFE